MPTVVIKRRKTKPSKYAWDKLTEKQRAFCEELVGDVGFDLTAAARRAGYGGTGKNAPQAVTKLLKNKTVMAYLGWLIEQRRQRRELEADDVLEHLRNALFLDPLDLFDNEGGVCRMKELSEVPEHVRRCITKLKLKSNVTEYGTETTLELELMGKDAAMTNALKHLGLIRPDGTAVNINVSGGPSNGDLLDEAEQERKVIDAEFIAKLVGNG